MNGGARKAPFREARALELRAAGASYRTIADELHCSIAAAHGAVVRGLRKWSTPVADELLPLELERLDQLQRSAWDQAIAGDDAARNFILRLMERRSRLLGLDAPKKVDVRAIIEEWSQREGLDPTDVATVVGGLLQGL
jgi:hypothetical protein